MSPADQRDDLALIAAAQAGDRVAVDTLLRRHHDRIHAICRRLTGSTADAHDATQEALIAIVRGLPRFDGRASFSTWAYRVATNACLDELRRRSRRPVPSWPDGVPPHEPVDDSPTLDAAVADHLDLDQALANLPIEFRAPVIMRDILGSDYAEIAATLGIPPGTVRSRIARGRTHLARALGNQAPPPERPTPGRGPLT